MENGGSGGRGGTNNSSGGENGGGGAGNPAGYGRSGGRTDGWTYGEGNNWGINHRFDGENGTGGLLILYSDSIRNLGTIQSDGCLGGIALGGGGSSGGGSINVFYKNSSESTGIYSAKGGKAVGTSSLGRSRRKWNSFNRKNNEWKLYR